MEENQKKIEELNASIKNWQEEIDNVWSKRNTNASQDEIRNLRNLINNAKREIDRLEGNENVVTQTSEVNPEEVLKKVQKEKESETAEKGRLKLSIERLKEERKDYTGNKDLYDEYTRKIEEVEKELGKLEMTQTEKYERITTLKINLDGLKEKREKFVDNKEKYEEYTKIIEKVEKEYEELIKKEEEKEKNIKILTKGKIQEEKEKKEIESAIKKKQLQISEVEYDTENAMEEVELSSGEKIKQPKVIRLYKELDELKEKLKGKDDKIKEYQDAIDQLKGIEKEKQNHELTPDETRYYHGQGDLREYGGENGEDTRKNRLDNDQYFAEEPKKEDLEQTDNQQTDKGQEQTDNQQAEEGQDQTDNQQTDKGQGQTEGDPDQKFEDIFSNSKVTVKNIRIDAKTGKAYITSSRGGRTEINLDDAMKSKRQLFKNAGINSILKEMGATFMERVFVKRRINPVILAAIQSDPDLINDYVDSIINGEEMPFEYEASLSNPDMSKRAYNSLRRIGKREKEMGEHVSGISSEKGIRGLIGRIFNRNEQLPEAQEEQRGPTTRERKQAFVDRVNESSQNGDNNVRQSNNTQTQTKTQTQTQTQTQNSGFEKYEEIDL